MTTEEAIQYYGSQVRLAKALGISQGAISLRWGKYPPPMRQLQIQELTERKLLAEPGVLWQTPGAADETR